MSFDTRKQFIDKARLASDLRETSVSANLLAEPISRSKISEWTGKDVYIAIEGVIGVGKTSLARLLQDRWGCQGLFEGYEQNPFLTRGFYEDQKTHGFNTEIFFLLTRYRQQEALHKLQGSLISDYLFQKNHIFAQMNLTGLDLEIFRITYENFAKYVRKPDLIVLLEADLETVLRRIYVRDREFERSLSPAYLENLMGEYYRFFSSYADAPVLRLNTRTLDFVNDSQDFVHLAEAIEERLKGTRQLSLGELSLGDSTRTSSAAQL